MKASANGVEIPLRDLCQSITDGDHQAPPRAENGVPFITISAMRKGSVDLDSAVRFVPQAYAASLDASRKPKAGDILYSVTGSIGLSALVSDRADFVFQRHIAILRPDQSICDPRWLNYILASPQIREQAQTVATGTAQLTVPLAGLRSFKVPLSSLRWQRDTVAKLDGLTMRLARARAELENALRLASHLKTTTVAAIFGDDERHRALLSTVLVDIRYGTAKKCDYEGGATPVLRIPNVQNGKIKLENLKSANFDTKELRRLALDPGDILIIRSNGSISLVGSSAVVSESERGMLYAGYLIRLRLSQAHCLPEYLQFFLQSKSARSALESAARSTSGVHNINAEHLRALVLPLPDIQTQGEAVKQLQAAFARAERLEAEAARATELLDRLEASILAKAFRGELVLQDPEDEPASALLDRIRAERAASPKARRGRGAAGSAEAR